MSKTDSIQDFLMSEGYTYSESRQVFEKWPKTIPVSEIAGHTVETFIQKAQTKGWVPKPGKTTEEPADSHGYLAGSQIFFADEGTHETFDDSMGYHGVVWDYGQVWQYGKCDFVKLPHHVSLSRRTIEVVGPDRLVVARSRLVDNPNRPGVLQNAEEIVIPYGMLQLGALWINFKI